MVGSWVRHAGRDHVRVADRLDLLEVVALREGVELAEQSVEQPDDLGRGQALRTRREVDDVGEQDGRGAELVGDLVRARLQPFGDRAREDVEEQGLRALVLGRERGEGIRALLREERQEREHDRPADRDVQGEHQAGEPGGHR